MNMALSCWHWVPTELRFLPRRHVAALDTPSQMGSEHFTGIHLVSVVRPHALIEPFLLKKHFWCSCNFPLFFWLYDPVRCVASSNCSDRARLLWFFYWETWFCKIVLKKNCNRKACQRFVHASEDGVTRVRACQHMRNPKSTILFCIVKQPINYSLLTKHPVFTIRSELTTNSPEGNKSLTVIAYVK